MPALLRVIEKMKKKYVFALLFLLVTAGMVFAEDKPSAPVVNLERIVVTPSRIAKALSDVAAGMHIVTEEDLKNADAKTVPDALKNVEGVYAYDATGVGAGGTMNMRGFYGGMSSQHLVMIDGVPQNKGKDKLVNWDLIPVDNIERIEVMKGPASSLYGDNAMSGVINIITKKPAAGPHAGASFSYGSFATQTYGSYLSGTRDRLGYYLGVSSRLSNGFREHGDYENIVVYGRSTYAISDAQDLALSFDYSAKTQGAFPWALSATQIAQNRRVARPGTENDSTGADNFSVNPTFRWNIGGPTDLETSFYYRFGGMESFYTSGASQNTTREQIERENTYGLPVKLQTAAEIFGMEHSFVAGVDLERNDFAYEENSAPFQNRRGAPLSSYDVTKDKVGPYLQDDIEISDLFKCIAGVRYDRVAFFFCDRRVESNSRDKVMAKVDPSCGIVVTYQEGSELYGNFGKAFRTPTIGQMFTYSGSANIDLLPEESTNYEVGIRHNYGDRLRTSAGVYWMKIKNEIWYDTATRRYQNYGRTFHDGLEASADLKVTDGFSLFGNYAYTRAVNDSEELKNRFLTNVPINKGTAGVNIYTKSGVSAYVTSTWVGKAYIDQANDDTLGHYATVDTKVSYRYRWCEVFFSVYNLFDKEYNSSGYKSVRVNYFTPEPGRTYAFGISGDF